jgi:4-hydroxy-tetrahydrodipicolinate synthase
MPRIITALVTPFTLKQNLDLAGLRRLLEDQRRAGIKEWILFGSTGENHSVLPKERMRVVEFCRDWLKPTESIWTGIGTSSTSETIYRGIEAEAAGSRKHLVVTPYYNKPSQAGLLAHYKAIHEALDGEIYLYQVPSRTGVQFEMDTILELSHLPRIRGLKDSSGDLMGFMHLRQKLQERSLKKPFELFMGEDAYFLPSLAVGADGLISVASHLIAKDLLQIEAWMREGPTLESTFAARKLFLERLSLIESLFIESNPVPVKRLLKKKRLIEATVRPPLAPLTPTHEKALLALWEDV